MWNNMVDDIISKSLDRMFLQPVTEPIELAVVREGVTSEQVREEHLVTLFGKLVSDMSTATGVETEDIMYEDDGFLAMSNMVESEISLNLVLTTFVARHWFHCSVGSLRTARTLVLHFA